VQAVSNSLSDGLSSEHPNARLIDEFYRALKDRDAEAMAACYVADARFEDLAFELYGREAIRQMWLLVCSKEVTSEIEGVAANDHKGRARWLAHYSFGERNRHVDNDTRAEFIFRDGRIAEQIDHADPLAWARQAFPFPLGEVIGRNERLRRCGARQKLDAFLRAQWKLRN
jgi:ketosteroid isomerase-like protein